MRKRKSRSSRSCPVSYAEFRTGHTFGEVYHMIYGRKWKRRRGVLGFWHELKQRMYAQYLEEAGR